MSNRAASQGGALLRTSRMFSLPAKLPSPPGTNSTMASQVFKSNTATDVFPTYQTVTTYPSSRLRGDWGFKRPLPLRSTTRSKTPLIRVKHIDSIEHVTDFNSASDHTLTVEKFHQLGVPLTIPPQKTQDKFLSTAKDLTEGTSVFEEDFDAADGNTSTNKRWKFSGPWLAGIPEGHFQKYLTKKVRYRRNEFKNYLREVLAKEMNVANRNAALEQGVAPQFEDAELIAADITEEQLTEYIRVLRNDRPRLFEHVGKFLDLAPLDTELAQMSFLPKATGESTSLVFNHNPYAQNGPPITHPSAGMSYIRTSAYMTNHPVYGPQKQHPAIRANVLQPKSPAFGRFAPTVGVAGIVASVATTDSNFQSTSRNNISGLNSFDSESDRAPEVNVQPLWARIGSDGRVILKVKQADTENVAVQKELRGEEKIFGTPLRDANALLAQGGSLEPMPKRLQTQARTIMGNSRVYGFM